MNKVILMGRLTREPEVRYSAGESSLAIARYTLAVDRRTGKGTEQAADFIPCVAFGKKGEFAESKRDGAITHPQPAPADTGDGFMNIPEGMDEGLPFD